MSDSWAAVAERRAYMLTRIMARAKHVADLIDKKAPDVLIDNECRMLFELLLSGVVPGVMEGVVNLLGDKMKELYGNGS